LKKVINLTIIFLLAVIIFRKLLTVQGNACKSSLQNLRKSVARAIFSMDSDEVSSNPFASNEKFKSKKE